MVGNTGWLFFSLNGHSTTAVTIHKTKSRSIKEPIQAYWYPFLLQKRKQPLFSDCKFFHLNSIRHIKQGTLLIQENATCRDAHTRIFDNNDTKSDVYGVPISLFVYPD